MSHDSQIREFVIFVNYRRSDSGWPADRLTDKLKSTFGEALVFLDTRDIAAGNDFSSEIEDHLQRASVLIVLIGKDWLRVQDRFGRRRLDHNDDWVRTEIRTALTRQDCLVIPVLIDDAELPAEAEALPEDISALIRRQRLQLRQTNSEQDIESLCTRLESVGFKRRHLGGPLGNQQFSDKDVASVVEQLVRLYEKHNTEVLPWPELIGELDLLFNRKTFRFESLRGCPEQRWADRLDSAYQTLQVLQLCLRNVRETAMEKYPTYVELVSAVDKYCMQMGALLFDPSVDYNRIAEHIGKPTFKAHLPKEIRFPAGPDRQPKIPDSVNDQIDLHRVDAVAAMDRLMKYREASQRPLDAETMKGVRVGGGDSRLKRPRRFTPKRLG